MNISDNSYNISGNYNSPVTAQVNKGEQSEITRETASANTDIIQVNEGESFKGQVMDINGKNVSILLDNNKLLYARMSDKVDINIGDMLNFVVKENNMQSLIISPITVDSSSMKDSAIFKILENNNLTMSDKNYSIAEGLMNNNMPVDKAGMVKIMQQSYKYPDVPVDTLIRMTKMEIPINEASIKQFNDYMNNKHQLSSDIQKLSLSIVDMHTEAINNIGQNEPESVLDINKQLLAVFSDYEALSETDAIPLNDSVVLNNTENATSLKDAVMSDEVINTKINSLIDNIAKDNNQLVDNIRALVDNLKELGVSDKEILSIMDKSQDTLKLLNNLNELISKFVPNNPEDIKNLLTSEQYNFILNSSIKDKLLLNPEKMSNPQDIDKLYIQIAEKSNQLSEMFSSAGNSFESFKEQAKSTGDRIDFINQLNDMYAYAQLPVKLNQGEVNSELFVYMNKKRIQSKKDAVSALLHLDMEHLGPTDVHISLHGGVIHTKFYVEDEKSAKIIDEHMNMLEKAINECGYSLTNEVITRPTTQQDKTNMVTANMFDSDLERSVKRYSFDVRM